MSRRLRFNAFEMNCVAHQSPGLWTFPGDRARQYKDIGYWTDLALILEEGRFDGIFIADVIGSYDVYGGSNGAALREAAQVPVNDPLQLAVPISMVTEHLGIGITASTSYEHPYLFARRLSTADHLTKGRIGWNIVTSYLESGARNTGIPLRPHDDRYEVAAEYLEVIGKLLEGSWEEDAVLADPARRIYADPAKVHPIRHKGRCFDVPGPHLCEPSPQRSPVLYQAGASRAGIGFAAKHAECVFVSTPTQAALARYITALSEAAAAQGRQRHDFLVYALATVIVEETDAKAQALYQHCLDHVSTEGALVLLSGWTGADLSAYAPGDPLAKIRAESGLSMLERFADQRDWSLADLARWAGIGGAGPVIVGGPETVADQLEAWQETTGVDGFNLARVTAHQTFANVTGYLVPELQRRGIYPRDYAPGTLRQKLFGQGDRLRASHPAARFRHPAAMAEAPGPHLVPPFS
ncbi:LLM class flavin-dependent oxidoreductase [Pseudogemmobacter bohemicus]|uniref:LLM class flavin-dependent oxidoreductase n=1 Tax=Pseudogemmobacter bohemicus TaxID=2250708 RepID=UPI000DD3F8E7|nr:LLM class flavin-dependent oxidoreductase [Pseudogemmobacter bohemicus]